MSDVSIKKAAMINFISKYSNIFLQLIINSILARLLTPDDYGIVAVINVFISFFTIVADMGIGPAIIQHKELRNKNISDIFLFTAFTAIIISIIFALFSYPLSVFYENSVYISLGMILSFSVFFNILNIVPNAILLKNKKFKLLGIRTIVVNIIGAIITIILAAKGAKYYALVINSVLIAFLTFSLNFYNAKIKIYFSYSNESIIIIRNYSAYQFAFNFINYFSRNLDNLLIGKFLGKVPLGYYDKAYQLMLYPIQSLTNVITPVLHPILSEHANEKDIIYEKYIKVVKLLALLGVFVTVFCFFATEEIILIMFGKQWVNSIPAFRILSLSIVIQMVLSSSGAIFQAANETKKLFLAGTLGAVANVTGIVIGLLLGKIEYVALGVSLAYYINFITGFYLLINKALNKSLFKFYKNFGTAIIIAIICSISMIVFSKEIDNILLSVIYKGIICLSSYIMGLIVTKEIKYFKSLIKK